MHYEVLTMPERARSKSLFLNLSVVGSQRHFEKCCLRCTRSMMADEENNQCNETIDNNIPEGPPEPPPPPDRPVLPQNEPRDVELEGERKVDVSCNNALTTDEADASGVPRCGEDTGTEPKKLQNAIERVSKLPDHRVRGNSPRRVPDSPDEPGGETAVPDGAQSIQGHPRAHLRDADNEANASTQDRWRGGHIGQQEAL